MSPGVSKEHTSHIQVSANRWRYFPYFRSLKPEVSEVTVMLVWGRVCVCICACVHAYEWECLTLCGGGMVRSFFCLFTLCEAFCVTAIQMKFVCLLP